MTEYIIFTATLTPEQWEPVTEDQLEEMTDRITAFWDTLKTQILSPKET